MHSMCMLDHDNFLQIIKIHMTSWLTYIISVTTTYVSIFPKKYSFTGKRFVNLILMSHYFHLSKS